MVCYHGILLDSLTFRREREKKHSETNEFLWFELSMVSVRNWNRTLIYMPIVLLLLQAVFFFFFGYVQYNFAGKIGAISEWADKFRQKSRNIYFLTKELFENGNIKYKICCEKSPHNCHTFVLNNYLFIDNCAAISHVDRRCLLLFLCFLSFLFETIFWLTFLKLNYS